jgi:hypothetical protein
MQGDAMLEYVKNAPGCQGFTGLGSNFIFNSMPQLSNCEEGLLKDLPWMHRQENAYNVAQAALTIKTTNTECGGRRNPLSIYSTLLLGKCPGSDLVHKTASICTCCTLDAVQEGGAFAGYNTQAFS